MSKPTVIAIDGPAASGKSTIGCELAKRLNYLYFDSGAMYRAVTWAALAEGLDISDEAAITTLAERLVIDVVPPTGDDGRQYTVLVDGRDVTWDIRTAEVEGGVSAVSTYQGVREALVMQQRRIGSAGRMVMVGRDIGTIVLPDAGLKIFLDAQVKERAARRHSELIRQRHEVSYDSVLAAMQRRDEIDSGREIAPLKAADDAIIIDTTDLTIDQVLAVVEELVHKNIN